MTSDLRLSKLLSLALRHQPDALGLELDRAGWTDVERLLAGLGRELGRDVPRAELERLVRESDKQRFALSPDGARIRANQGHSVPVDLGLQAVAPPVRLFHGTVARALPAIRREGLSRRARHHVHLSADEGTAVKVGDRRGRALVLVIRAGEMAAAGHGFWRAANGVWLADHVPPEFIDFPAPPPSP